MYVVPNYCPQIMLILCTLQTCELTHMRHGVLEPVGQLEGVHVVEPVLDVAVHNQLGHAEDLTTQVERVAEPALLTLLGGQGLDRLQVEVVVQMQVVQIFPSKEIRSLQNEQQKQS